MENKIEDVSITHGYYFAHLLTEDAWALISLASQAHFFFCVGGGDTKEKMSLVHETRH